MTTSIDEKRRDVQTVRASRHREHPNRCIVNTRAAAS